jgi:hypothetical protein
MAMAMVTMATELFCSNKLLENLRYSHVVLLSIDLRVKRINVTIPDTNSKCCSNFGTFSLKFCLLCFIFCLSDILWQRITEITLINTT